VGPCSERRVDGRLERCNGCEAEQRRKGQPSERQERLRQRKDARAKIGAWWVGRSDDSGGLTGAAKDPLRLRLE
jgi:hypothetical protein